MIADQQDLDVFVGLDVGKSGHHAVAWYKAGHRLFDKALPNDEARSPEILTGLSKHGKVLLVVDQPASIGALPVAVAQAAGAAVGYLPGLAMRGIPYLHPGQAKTGRQACYSRALSADNCDYVNLGEWPDRFFSTRSYFR